MAKKVLKKGLFITFEGVEGCGKSTHSRRIYKMLLGDGFDCIYIREPGGTRIGEKIRRILLDRRNKGMSDRAELFLFEANRSQIIKEIIAPALKMKKIVICDRFYDSTTAYQGYADGLDVGLVEKLNRFASYGITPDLTFVLDLGPKTGLKRAVRYRMKDRMEAKTISYHARVGMGYKRLARKYPKRIKLVKVRTNINKTFEHLKKQVLRIVGKQCRLKI